MTASASSKIVSELASPTLRDDVRRILDHLRHGPDLFRQGRARFGRHPGPVASALDRWDSL